MNPNLSIRNKIAIGSLVLVFLLFLFTSPVAGIISDLFSPPARVDRLTIEQTAGDIRLEWSDLDNDSDLASYVIQIDEMEFEVGRNIRNFEVDNYSAFVGEQGSDAEGEDEADSAPQMINFEFRSKDIFGLTSESIDFEITTLAAGSVGQSYSFQNDASESNAKIIAVPIVVAVFSLLVSLWIFGTQIWKGPKEFILSLYSGLIVYPTSLLTLTIADIGVTDAESLSFIQSLFVLIIITIVSYLIIYYMYLTVNILYNSINKTLPLEQAAKASQFLFSLISAYFVMIFFFPRVEEVALRTVFISFFIFMYSLTAIVMLREVTYIQALSRAGAIMLASVISLFIISMWPINYVYSILSIAVIFYILLSVSLEIRQNIGRYVWLEYTGLFVLIFLIFITNASWGIEGGIFF